jgi:hypothetical protein
MTRRYGAPVVPAFECLAVGPYEAETGEITSAANASRKQLAR